MEGAIEVATRALIDQINMVMVKIGQCKVHLEITVMDQQITNKAVHSPPTKFQITIHMHHILSLVTMETRTEARQTLCRYLDEVRI
jgi:hypothetical protein